MADVKEANRALENSMDTRQEVKDHLSSYSRLGDMEALEKIVKALSVAKLNKNICGAPGDEECSKSECGGALCRDIVVQRECGGPTCKGSVPVSHNTTKTAAQLDNCIGDLLHKLQDSKISMRPNRRPRTPITN
ncbi:laminin subunit beta-4-like [Oncorhynchus masou masou]|uniref:laminin subunit beta-4-like n=1 Tax=Oncorhynchus masou masou TaxID=90313 RepID=UPI003183FB87